MIRLLKFRALEMEIDLCRAKEIIETNSFWCSKLWNLNDPMEGVYINANLEIIQDIFNEKNNRIICSFSNIRALKNHLLWGYYTNGFKGIAIEIEIQDNEVNKINYIRKKELNKEIKSIEELITRKLKIWKHENEYRFIEKSNEEGFQKIGKITAIYFGKPYGNIDNFEDVKTESRTIKNYLKNKDKLIQFCKKKSFKEDQTFNRKHKTIFKLVLQT